MPWYIFGCAQGHRTGPARSSYATASVTCAECGEDAPRLPFYGDNETFNPSGQFEPDHERFLDRAAEVEYAYSRADQETGEYVARPKWLNAGVARARSRIIQGGTARELREVTRISESVDANRKRR